jgi:glutaredoxin
MYYIYTTLVSFRRNVLRETKMLEHLLKSKDIKFKTIDISVEEIKNKELIKNVRLPILLWNNEFVGTYISIQEMEDKGILKMNLENNRIKK